MMPVAPEQSLSEVFRLLGERAGIEPESIGVGSVAHAVRQQMAAVGAASPGALCSRLMADPSALAQLLEELLVPETWFFRDPLAFQSLARRLADCRSSPSTVRLLSIGCSTGEEVYSLAVALREAGLEPPQYRILGVDLSRNAIAWAEAGKYPPRSFRQSTESAAAWRSRWCQQAGDAWQVRDALRESVQFRRANLSQPDFLADEPAFDVIFCRNVLIYFHARARRTAVDHVRRLLRPNGLVCSAAAEAGIFADAGFRSLGGECPFAFSHPDSNAAPPANTSRGLSSQAMPGSPNNEVPRPKSSAAARNRMPRRPRPDSPSGAPKPPLSAAAASGHAAPTQQWPEMLQAAEAAADQGRLEEADVLCQQILAEDAACADAHCLRGIVWQARGQLPEAQRSFEKALYLEPRHYRSLLHVMLLAEGRGDLPAAANYRRRMQEGATGETK